MRNPFNLRRGVAGFTFLEIMLVVMIIGLLAAVVGPRVVQQGERARIRTTRLQIDAISSGLKLYALDVGTYPSTQQGLQALLVRPSQVSENVWDGPYIDATSIPVDGWQKPFRYAYPGQHNEKGFDLFSVGPDGVENNADDVTNWVKP